MPLMTMIYSKQEIIDLIAKRIAVEQNLDVYNIKVTIHISGGFDSPDPRERSYPDIEKVTVEF